MPISYEERGKEIGKEIGRNEGTRKIVQNMAKEGFPLNTTAKITELPMEEIKLIMEKVMINYLLRLVVKGLTIVA